LHLYAPLYIRRAQQAIPDFFELEILSNKNQLKLRSCLRLREMLTADLASKFFIFLYKYCLYSIQPPTHSGKLVVCQDEIDGYNLVNLMRASSVL